jgi:L-alanine-DL-glutamate epimerase-like enolase superfamily enzyme
MYMLEQPFPLRFLDEGDLARWMELKQVYRELGVEIIADESVATKEDVVALAPYSTGVNVKIEKSGGFRGAIASFIAADKYGLHKWVGIMIGSSLNST